MNKPVVRSVRFSKESNVRVEQAARTGGFSSPSSFIRAAVERDLAGHENGMEENEQRVVASLDRVARELRSVRLRQQAEFAFLDALVKMMLTHMAELPSLDSHGVVAG